jgi:hypothetical protein
MSRCTGSIPSRNMVAKRIMVWTCASVLCTLAHSQTFTGFPRQSGPLTGQEMVPADTGVVPPSVVFSTGQMAQFVNGLDPGQNWLIAGDAAQNLWQRGTTGPTSGVVPVFGPDRWAYWSGASTPVVVSRAAQTRVGFGYSYRVQRTSGATGMSRVCMGQEISSVNSVALQGKVVEVDFGLVAGANFSSGAVEVLVVSGTGINEGVSALASGIGGGSGWTGQTNVVDAFFSPVGLGLLRPGVVGRMSNIETEAAVVVCWTPGGTAGAADYIDLSGIQMRLAPALAAFVSGSVAYDANAVGMPAFLWRHADIEGLLQYAFYWQVNESAGVSAIGLCRSVVSTEADCLTTFPVPMVRVPDMGFVVGFAVDANAGGLVPCTGLGVVTGMVQTQRTVTLACTTASNVRSADFLYNNGGGGVIMANAEWM